MHGLLIAEKPSVKRAVEAVYKKEAGKLPFTLDFAAFHGHLMQLLEPADYNPAWSDWSNLPVIPDAFRYKADDVKPQMRSLCKPSGFISLQPPSSSGLPRASLCSPAFCPTLKSSSYHSITP